MLISLEYTVLELVVSNKQLWSYNIIFQDLGFLKIIYSSVSKSHSNVSFG